MPNPEEDYLFQDAVSYISAGNFKQAKANLEMIPGKLTKEQIKTDLKYIEFWIEREEKHESIEEHYQKGLFLIKQWKTFLLFTKNLKDKDRDGKVFYAIKSMIFGQALYDFSRFGSESKIVTAGTLFNMGLCYKNIGNYETAIENLEAANSKKNSDAAVLAELADCYDLINEPKAAKIFFREAFYIDPQKIEIEFLESRMINKLTEQLVQNGYSGAVLKEWIPVYGVLRGIFNIKRELKGLELAQLKQSIITLENNLNEDEGNKELNIPRLINKYIWLIDYYRMLKDNRSRIEDILRKIRNLNPAVYELYIN